MIAVRNDIAQKIIEVLETLSYDLSIVTETASIAQYANFDLKVSYIDDDIYAFIEDYVNTIASKQKRWGLNITYINSERENLKVEFLPSEICTFISNIFSVFTNLIDLGKISDYFITLPVCNSAVIRLFSKAGNCYSLRYFTGIKLFRTCQ